MSGSVLIDDVTLRMLELQGVDQEAWIKDLPTSIGRDDHRHDEVHLIVGATVRLVSGGPSPVYNTFIRLADEVRYTRGDVQPGPQLIIDGHLSDTVMAALTGMEATRVLDHRALRGCTVRDMFASSSYTYANLDMPMHVLDIGRDLEQERRDGDRRIDEMLARCGSRDAMRRLSRTHAA